MTADVELGEFASDTTIYASAKRNSSDGVFHVFPNCEHAGDSCREKTAAMCFDDRRLCEYCSERIETMEEDYVSYDIDDDDRRKCTEILEQHKRLGSRSRDSPERTSLEELDLDPTDTVVVSDGRWAFDNIFHLTDECHHLQGEYSKKEAQQLRDDWLLCWQCDKTQNQS